MGGKFRGDVGIAEDSRSDLSGLDLRVRQLDLRHRGRLVRRRIRPGECGRRLRRAIQTALAHADWGASPALSVRIGLHVGEAEERDGNFFGPTVNQTARVMGVAHGGQFAKVEKTAAVIERWVNEYLEATDHLDALNAAAANA